MHINQRRVVLLALAFGITTRSGAQQVASCSDPGAAFKVSAYQCASCTVRHGSGARTTYLFDAEPVVLEVESGSALRPGDVVEAVNGHPITTRAGADAFTYPDSGWSTITVRRGNERLQLTATGASCAAAPASGRGQRNADIRIRGQVDGPLPGIAILPVVDGVVGADIARLDRDDVESVEVLKGAAAVAAYGPRAQHGVVVITTKRGKSASPNARLTSSGGTARFGFGIGCPASCTHARTTDGTEYYTFTSYPSIVGITAGGPAALAGLRVGDLITEVDGKSVLDGAGALEMARASREDTVRVTVLQDGKRTSYVLRAR